MTQETRNQGLHNGWLLAGGGGLMQLALGAVYAWSVVRIPFSKAFGWSIQDVTWAFSLRILALGFAAFIGGLWIRKVGTRVVGITAGICYGLGVSLSSLASGNIWILWLSYGVLGGIGLGLGYIVPLATLVRWFPDRRGFITGLAVAGFGGGALITAPVAQQLIASFGPLPTLAILGVGYFIMVVLGSSIMRNPPEGWRPAGWQPSAKQQEQLEARDYTLKEALSTCQWYVLWAMLFLNVTAGISIISQASPMAQEISGVSAAVGAGMVGVISIGNGIGRLFWAWSSDAIGRRNVFLIMFLLQAALFFLLPSLRQFTMLALVCFIIISCYGGGFGTMPAFAADYFGPKWVGAVYGLMLTAWGLAGVFWPLLIANIRQATGNYGRALSCL